jgi:opacity protein-like surface antigen
VLPVLFVSVPALPQWFSFGVKGGVPLTNAFEAAFQRDFGYVSDTKRYTLGPVVELRLPLSLGVEFNALYKRLNYDSTQAATTANSWEFPLLLKVRSPSPPVRPYFSVGPSFRRLSDVRQTVFSVLGGNPGVLRPTELQNRFSAGFAIGAGVELGDRLRIAPEIRYTRWGWENFQQPSSGFRTNLNQLDFLLGLHF